MVMSIFGFSNVLLYHDLGTIERYLITVSW
jgi:hypothetical protein